MPRNRIVTIIFLLIRHKTPGCIRVCVRTCVRTAFVARSSLFSDSAVKKLTQAFAVLLEYNVYLLKTDGVIIENISIN